MPLLRKKATFGNKNSYGGTKLSPGGLGLKAIGKNRRKFKPNLQKVNEVG